MTLIAAMVLNLDHWKLWEHPNHEKVLGFQRSLEGFSGYFDRGMDTGLTLIIICSLLAHIQLHDRSHVLHFINVNLFSLNK